jgi:Cu2+-exporting ATPase
MAALSTSFASAPRSDARPLACLHCRLPLPGAALTPFCCRGCEEVHRLLASAGLSRYYELGGGDGHPIVRGAVDRKWLEPITEGLAAQTDQRADHDLARVTLDVQGVHCVACVWLFEELFRRRGGAGIVVNPTVGSVELTITPDFPLAAWVEEIEAFGYQLGPPLKAAEDERRAGSSIVWRMGVCIAIAMNTMIFGIAIYAGLGDGRVYRLFHALDFALSFVSVLVGGTVFFRSAWQALVRRVLHLDLPIALGILLAFSSSTYTYLTRGGSTSYFDTINVFIALMLVGRFLQERVLLKNRVLLLASDGANALYTRRVADGAVELTRCTDVALGDTLLIAHQDLVPVDAELVSEAAMFSLDWINGESAPRVFATGDVVPAGAFCQSSQAATVRARASFDRSAIASLLRTGSRRDHDQPRSTPWWKRLTAVYVASVLAIASSSFLAWLLVTRDLARSLDVVAAVLIVTCPCAFGIATPLAYELAQAGLRRAGLFVRTSGFLDRATAVRRVVFDKTGTLTTGALVMRNPEVLAALSPEARAIAYDLAVRSSHPRSQAITLALGSGQLHQARKVRELPGKGMKTSVDGHVWRLGAPAWAAHDRVEADVVLSRDGQVVAALVMGEEPRPDFADEVRALARRGYELFILSGDSPAATRAMARACGIPEDHAFGACAPEEKAAWLRKLGASEALFVGDGINDSLVAEEAHCAGTPAIDRPFMAARCDFYFVSPGLRPVRTALDMAKRLARVVHTNLAIAILYNVVTVSLAVLGRMTPLWCAVLMPLSSVSTVLATTFQLARPKWTS